jgi:hypothetical protein
MWAKTSSGARRQKVRIAGLRDEGGLLTAALRENPDFFASARRSCRFN